MRFLELHAIHTYPAGLPNRDANNLTKTVTFGDVLRARISSQSLKRAQRMYLREVLAEAMLAQRTKLLPRLVADQLVARGVDREVAEAAGRYVLRAAGFKLNPKRPLETQVLLFCSAVAEQRFADLMNTPERLQAALDWERELAALSQKKEAAKKAKKEKKGDAAEEEEVTEPVIKDEELKASAVAVLDPVGLVDVALFGRMLAEGEADGVDAAAQVAHAFSVDRFAAEPDFFTAVDDRLPSGDVGAGMMGYTDVGSHTMYRFACVSMPQLEASLPGVSLDEVAAAYVRAFCLANPAAKTHSSGTAVSLPSTVVVAATDRPVNLADVFVRPVEAAEGPVDEVAAARLLARWGKVRSGVLAANAAVWSVHDVDALCPPGMAVVQTLDDLFASEAVAGPWT